MDKFLEIYTSPRLNHEEIENMNRPIISKEIESVVKNLPTQKCPGWDGFINEFYQTLRDELKPILLKLFQKNWRRGNHHKLILRGPNTKAR